MLALPDKIVLFPFCANGVTPFSPECVTLAITLPDSRHLSDEVLSALRLRALHAYELGYTQKQIAAVLGINRVVVSRWWTAYQRYGLSAWPLGRSGRPTGSSRLLTPACEKYVQHLLDTENPRDLGIAAPLWTRRAVAELIQKTCHVDLPVRTAGLYLRRWGFSPKRPRRKARQQDPAEVQEWLEKTYPAVAARAEREGADVWWGDETGMDADESRDRGYARRGQTPEKEVSGDRRRVNVVAAITARGQLEFETSLKTMTAERFICFLAALEAAAPRKVVLIVDRLRAHLTPEVLDWMADHQERIILVALPRYAPELNPVEYMNNNLKEVVNAIGLPSGAEELLLNIQRFLMALKRQPERVRSFFCHPAVRYATIHPCN